jgi:hypothetical protein
VFTFHLYILVLNPKTSFKTLETGFEAIRIEFFKWVTMVLGGLRRFPTILWLFTVRPMTWVWRDQGVGLVAKPKLWVSLDLGVGLKVGCFGLSLPLICFFFHFNFL